MSGGQHRNDEANGPSRSGERETERSRKAREPSTKPATAQIHGCAQENKKLRQNALDGADFVRDVLDSYHSPLGLCEYWCACQSGKSSSILRRVRTATSLGPTAISIG